jgi:type IV pilus assembly protein PilX
MRISNIKPVTVNMTNRSNPSRFQTGASMVVTLLMIVVVSSLAAAAARFALSGERSSRGDRDRELAFQAAETALADGERDVVGGFPSAARSDDFCSTTSFGFPDVGSGCDSSTQNLGKCLPPDFKAGQPQTWLVANWTTQGVPVGRFTGGAFYPTQNGTASWLSSREPRYLIERFPDVLEDTVDSFAEKGPGKQKFLYQITAIGYATRSDVKVVLQSIVRKVSC